MSLTTHDDAPTTFFLRGPQAGHVLPRPAPVVAAPTRFDSPQWELGLTVFGMGAMFGGGVRLIFSVAGEDPGVPGYGVPLVEALLGLGLGAFLVAAFFPRLLGRGPVTARSGPVWRWVVCRPEPLGLALAIAGLISLLGRILTNPYDRAIINFGVVAQNPLFLHSSETLDPRFTVLACGAGILGALGGFIWQELLRLRS